jgi:hypothetical protein
VAVAETNSAHQTQSGAGVTTLTIAAFNSDSSGGATNTAAVFYANWGTTTIPSGLTVTWNGSATGISTITGASGNGAATSGQLWGMVGISGTHDLVISWTGAQPAKTGVISFSGANQTGGTTTFAHGTAHAQAVLITNPITITSATGNMTAAFWSDDGGTNFSSTTATQAYVDNTGSGSTNACAAYTAGSASNTMTATLAVADNSFAVGVDVVAAAASAAVVDKPRRQFLKR